MLPIHLRFSDGHSKTALAVRLRITDDAGIYYAPLGRLAQFACGQGEAVGGSVRLGKQNFTHIDGTCEISLPTGVPLHVQAWHGPEWMPLDRIITLGIGQLSLRLELQRWFDRKAVGWLALDTRVHFLSPHAAVMEAAAEDLDAVQVLAFVQPSLASDGHTYPSVPNLLDWCGAVSAYQRDAREVFVNTLNTHPVLGSLALLQAHRVIYPLAFGAADGPDDASVCDWADQCHRKHGLVVWCDAFRDPLHSGGEALIALILLKIDALEVDAQPRAQPLLPWIYRLWNAGFAIPLCGASGKSSNRTALGAMRTYARGENGIEAIRSGSTFISNGPILTWTCQRSTLSGRAESITGFDRLELVVNGVVVATAASKPTDGRTMAILDSITLPQETRWWAMRCSGRTGSGFSPDQIVFAHTSAMSMTATDNALSVDRLALKSLTACLTKTREWLEHEGRFVNPLRKAQHLARCDEALAKIDLLQVGGIGDRLAVVG